MTYDHGKILGTVQGGYQAPRKFGIIFKNLTAVPAKMCIKNDYCNVKDQTGTWFQIDSKYDISTGYVLI